MFQAGNGGPGCLPSLWGWSWGRLASGRGQAVIKIAGGQPSTHLPESPGAWPRVPLCARLKLWGCQEVPEVLSGFPGGRGMRHSCPKEEPSEGRGKV